MMTNNTIFKDFWKDLGGAVKGFTGLVFEAISMVSKLGSAIMALLRGDFKRAAALALEALSGKAEAAGSQGSGSQGGAFKGTGDAQRDAWIKEASRKFGVPESKIAAMIEAESSFNPSATSPVGAVGYMQLMPDTFKGMGYTNINDPRQNIMAGTQYMGELYKKYGNWDMVYAAYNAGPGAVDKYGGVPPYAETQAHVRKVRENESKYLRATTTGSTNGSGSVYSLQSGMEDVNLAKTDPALVERFGGLATTLSSKGYGVEVSSGWRSPENNAASGGVDNSLHTRGGAMDFVLSGNYDPEEIKRIAKEKGINIIYHDAGSGLHFHAELDESSTPDNSTGTGWGDWWKNIKQKTSNAFSQTDAAPIEGLMGGASPDYATYGSGGGNTTIYQVDVGGVQVAETNASPEQIGNAVGNKTLEAINNRATYVLKNRALNGVPS